MLFFTTKKINEPGAAQAPDDAFLRKTSFMDLIFTMNIPIHPRFLEMRTGHIMQILIVFLPVVFVLRSIWLLVGLCLSTLLAWGMLRLCGKTWRDVGLRKPDDIRRLLYVTVIATMVLIPVSFAAKRMVMAITQTAPNLAAFQTIHGNFMALAVGLVVAWLFGAFLEELLFRGFLQNWLAQLFAGKGGPAWPAWTGAVLATSVVTGLGHCYQGMTGMLVAGFIAVGFSAIYLVNHRNLWASILSHGLYDTVALLLIYYGVNLNQMFGSSVH